MIVPAMLDPEAPANPQFSWIDVIHGRIVRRKEGPLVCLHPNHRHSLVGKKGAAGAAVPHRQSHINKSTDPVPRLQLPISKDVIARRISRSSSKDSSQGRRSDTKSRSGAPDASSSGYRHEVRSRLSSGGGHRDRISTEGSSGGGAQDSLSELVTSNPEDGAGGLRFLPRMPGAAPIIHLGGESFKLSHDTDCPFSDPSKLDALSSAIHSSRSFCLCMTSFQIDKAFALELHERDLTIDAMDVIDSMEAIYGEASIEEDRDLMEIVFRFESCLNVYRVLSEIDINGSANLIRKLAKSTYPPSTPGRSHNLPSSNLGSAISGNRSHLHRNGTISRVEAPRSPARGPSTPPRASASTVSPEVSGSRPTSPVKVHGHPRRVLVKQTSADMSNSPPIKPSTSHLGRAGSQSRLRADTSCADYAVLKEPSKQKGPQQSTFTSMKGSHSSSRFRCRFPNAPFADPAALEALFPLNNRRYVYEDNSLDKQSLRHMEPRPPTAASYAAPAHYDEEDFKSASGNRDADGRSWRGSKVEERTTFNSTYTPAYSDVSPSAAPPSSSPAASALCSRWILICNDGQACRVWYKPVPSSTELYFRLEGSIQAALLDVVAVMAEVEYTRKWVPFISFPFRLGLANVACLCRNGRFDKVSSYEVVMPWPFKNRASIVHGWMVDDLERNSSLTFSFRTISPIAKADGAADDDEEDNQESLPPFSPVTFCELPAFPSGTVTVRFDGGATVTPHTDGTCYVRMVCLIDPREKFNATIINFFAGKFMKLAFGAFKKQCTEVTRSADHQLKQVRVSDRWLYGYLESRLQQFADFTSGWAPVSQGLQGVTVGGKAPAKTDKRQGAPRFFLGKKA